MLFFLEFDNKFLLLHRSNEDLWDPCKGHVEKYESFVWLEKDDFLKKLKFEDVKSILKEYLEKVKN